MAIEERYESQNTASNWSYQCSSDSHSSLQAGPRKRVFEKKEFDQMMKANLAEPGTTEWAFAVVSVSQKDGRLCFCAGYR